MEDYVKMILRWLLCFVMAAMIISGTTRGAKAASADENNDTEGFSYLILSPNGAEGEEQKVWEDDGGLKAPGACYSREDYIFTGWNDEADGSGSTYYEGDEVPGGTTLYAQWLLVWAARIWFIQGESVIFFEWNSTMTPF